MANKINSNAQDAGRHFELGPLQRLDKELIPQRSGGRANLLNTALRYGASTIQATVPELHGVGPFAHNANFTDNSPPAQAERARIEQRVAERRPAAQDTSSVYPTSYANPQTGSIQQAPSTPTHAEQPPEIDPRMAAAAYQEALPSDRLLPVEQNHHLAAADARITGQEPYNAPDAPNSGTFETVPPTVGGEFYNQAQSKVDAAYDEMNAVQAAGLGSSPLVAPAAVTPEAVTPLSERGSDPQVDAMRDRVDEAFQDMGWEDLDGIPGGRQFV